MMAVHGTAAGAPADAAPCEGSFPDIFRHGIRRGFPAWGMGAAIQPRLPRPPGASAAPLPQGTPRPPGSGGLMFYVYPHGLFSP